MSHAILSSIWETLQRERDLSNILREILGQHALDLACFDATVDDSELGPFQAIVWIKTIFDLQRAYLQATAGAGHCHVPGILPADLLHSVLLYLLQAKAKIFRDGHLQSNSLFFRLILAHTSVSGFRLLILCSESLDIRALERFENALRDAYWTDKRCSKAEHFILFDLFPSMLGSNLHLNLQRVSNSNTYALGLRQLGLPTFTEGLYPVGIRPARLVASTVPNLEHRSLWITAYWTLFDATWSVEAAIIQAHVDTATRISNAAFSPAPRIDSANVVNQQCQTRSRLLAILFQPNSGPSSQQDIVESLKSTVVEWWLQQPVGTEHGAPEKQAFEFRYALDAFKHWLEARLSRTKRPSLSSECSLGLSEQTPLAFHASEKTNSIFFKETGSSNETEAMIPIKGLESTSSSTTTSLVHTPTTGSGSSSGAAPTRRPSSPRIEPLMSPLSVTASSSSRSDSGSTTLPTTTHQEIASSRNKTFLRFKSSKDKELGECSPCRPTSFVFSSSGMHLLLWGGNTQGLLRIRCPLSRSSGFEEGHKWHLGAIKEAAGGTDRCVALASVHQRFKLVSFSGTKPKPEAQLDLNIPLRHYSSCSLVVSRCDRYAALSVDETIGLYQLVGGTLRQLLLHDQIHLYQHLATQRRKKGKNNLPSQEAAKEAQNQSTVVEQRLAFSPTGDRLVVATQLADHHVYIDAFRTDRNPCITLSDNPRAFKLPPWTANDGGLTSVAFSDTHQCALLTAFKSKEYPNMISFVGGEDELTMHEPYVKVAHAAQGSDSSFILANGTTEILLLSWKLNGSLDVRKLKKCSAKIPSNLFKPGSICLSMPEPTTAFAAFWIKKSKLQLRRIHIGASDSSTDLDLRSFVDRLHAQPLDPIVLSNEPPGDSLAEPSMLHNNTTIRTLVELPGSLKTVAELPASADGEAG